MKAIRPDVLSAPSRLAEKAAARRAALRQLGLEEIHLAFERMDARPQKHAPLEKIPVHPPIQDADEERIFAVAGMSVDVRVDTASTPTTQSVGTTNVQNLGS